MNPTYPRRPITRPEPRRVLVGTGMPQTLLLQRWGIMVYEAFDEMPYHVGSSLRGKTWRDVDVRLLMEDDRFTREFPGLDPTRPWAADHHPRWQAICLAWATFGHAYTGLPIDFQIQQRSWANEKYGGGPRNPLGIDLTDHYRERAHEARTPRLVRQEQDHGCGVAALAMVTHQSYAEVHADCLAHHPGADHERLERLDERGLYHGSVEWYIGRRGGTWRYDYKAWHAADDWPPEPFAPVHICSVRNPGGAHYVVMRADGVVLDPLTDEERSLTDWDEVNNVMGIWL